MTAVKRKYTPNLKEFMALCSSNYAKLSRIVNLVDIELEQSFSVHIDGQPNLLISLKQRSEHTATYELLQESQNISLKRRYLVRMYHDPNKQMKQPDEKIQLNRFLAEWLNFCLEFGQSHSLNKTQLVFFD